MAPAWRQRRGWCILGAAGLYRNRMLGAAFAGLAAVISIALLMGLVCIGDACGQELYVLGRPLSAWGAAAHLISFMAFLFAPRLLLALWTVCVVSAHGWFYATNFTPCLLCTVVLGLGYLVAVLAFTVGPALRPHPVGLPIILGAFLIPVLAPGPPVTVLAANENPVKPAILHVHGKPQVPDAVAEPATTAKDAEPAPDEGSDIPLVPKDPEIPPEPVRMAPEGALVVLATPEGELVSVDTSTAPVVVVSPGCGHCTKVLEMMRSMENPPFLATTHVRGMADELESMGITGWYIYAGNRLDGVPALIQWDGEQKILVGTSAVLGALEQI